MTEPMTAEEARRAAADMENVKRYMGQRGKSGFASEPLATTLRAYADMLDQTPPIGEDVREGVACEVYDYALAAIDAGEIKNEDAYRAVDRILALIPGRE